MLVTVDADPLCIGSRRTTYRNFRRSAMQYSGWPPPAIAAMIMRDARSGEVPDSEESNYVPANRDDAFGGTGHQRIEERQGGIQYGW